uniref:Replication factor C C-terminal domain-containing protein n=1 Tax=Romanomermis culicivorax TaxID=13658 RepID=A0A915J5N1_ROMCU
MEKESKTTRFCLICNYISRIIEPLTSRCAKFRFKPLSTEIQTGCLKQICSKENIDIDDNALQALIEVCEGDLRRAITSLQSVSRYYSGRQIGLEHIDEFSGIIPVDVFEQYLTACRKCRPDLLERSVNALSRLGYSAYQLMNQLHDHFMSLDGDLTLNDDFCAKTFDKLALCEHRLLSGADEYLQLMDLGCGIMMAHKKSRNS